MGLLERKVIRRYPTREQVNTTVSKTGVLQTATQTFKQFVGRLFFKTNQSIEPSQNQLTLHSDVPQDPMPTIERDTIVEINQVREYANDEFLEQVLRRSRSPKSLGKRLAVMGEPGSGKTTLLQQMALWVGQEIEDSVPIWVSLADLQGQDLENYLFNTWLRSALRTVTDLNLDYSVMENSFKSLLFSGNVFLFLDGVDEMSNIQNLANPLREIGYQLEQSGCFAHTRIILSCRLNLWDNEFYILPDFDVFKTLSFSYPQQVEQFIHRYFLPYDAIKSQKQGYSLCILLRQQGNRRVQDLVRNPLCLTLLCWNWYRQEGNNSLPETKAGLYRQFVDSLYTWERDGKKYKLLVTVQQLKQLTEKIGLLARYCLENESTRFRFHEDILVQFLGNLSDESSLFNLVLKLGWINRVGEDTDNERKFIYAFFHASFTEYFAALSIDDSRFFFNHNPWNPNHRRASYRVFDAHWREVYLLWLGRDELWPRKRLRLIRALTNFRDGWHGFYQHQALLLAALGFNEMNRPKEYNGIVRQIVRGSLFDNGHLSFEDENKKFSRLSYSTLETLRKYGIDKNFLDGCDYVSQNPLLWKDRQAIARASQKFLQELEIDLNEQEDTRPTQTVAKESKLGDSSDNENLLMQDFFVSDDEQSPELNFVLQNFSSRPERAPEKIQKNIERHYHRINLEPHADKEEHTESICRVVPKLVSFLKEKPMGSIQIANSSLSLNWKGYLEFLIHISIEDGFFAGYLSDIYLTFSGIEKQNDDHNNPKFALVLESLKEIRPTEKKVELLLRLIKFSYNWVHNEVLERYSTYIFHNLYERIPTRSDVNLNRLDGDKTYHNLKLGLSKLVHLTNELSETLQTDGINFKVNEDSYTLWLDIISLLIQNNDTNELKDLDFINGIIQISRSLLANSPQTDIVIFSIFKDIYHADKIDGMLNTLPVAHFPGFSIDYLKGSLVNKDLEKRQSYYYLLYYCASKIPCHLFIRSFPSVQFKVLLMVQRVYTYLRRDMKFERYVAKTHLSNCLFRWLSSIFGFKFSDFITDFIIFTANLIITVLTWPFIIATSFCCSMLVSTWESYNKIRIECLYYNLMQSKWLTFDNLSRKTLILLLERMANSAKGESQALNNRGTGIYAFFIFLFLLCIPAVSEFVNQLTLVIIELIIYYYSDSIKSPEIYFLYLRHYNISNLSWLHQLGIYSIVLMLALWILQPDKDLVQEIISNIRTSRLNFFRDKGIGYHIKRLKNFFSFTGSLDQRDLVQSLSYIENENLWYSLSDDDQVGAIIKLIAERESRTFTSLPDSTVKGASNKQVTTLQEITLKTLYISLALFLLLTAIILYYQHISSLSFDNSLGKLVAQSFLYRTSAIIAALSFDILIIINVFFMTSSKNIILKKHKRTIPAIEYDSENEDSFLFSLFHGSCLSLSFCKIRYIQGL